MKLLIILILPFFLFTIDTHAESDNTQQLVSLDYQDATLWEVLRDLADQTDMNFTMDQNIQDKQITIYLDRVSLQDALSVISEVAQVRYSITAGNNYRFSAPE